MAETINISLDFTPLAPIAITLQKAGSDITIELVRSSIPDIEISFANIGPKGDKGDPGSGGSGDGLIEVVNEFHTGLTSNILTLNHEAAALTLCLHKAGSRLPTSQYLYTGSEVTLAVDPEITDEFIADYKYPS